MIINTLYDIGDTVYLVTDKDQLPRLIINIRIGPGTLCYTVVSATTESSHYEMEISKEKNIVFSMNHQNAD